LRRQLDFSSSLTSTAVPELSPRRVPRFVADQESRIGRRETDGTFPVCLGRKRPVPSLRASSSWEQYVRILDIDAVVCPDPGDCVENVHWFVS